MNGIVQVRSACSLVASSQMLAQLSSLSASFSIGLSILGMRHASVSLGRAKRRPSCLVLPAVLLHVAVKAQQVALIQLGYQNFPCAIKHLADRERLQLGLAVMKRHRLDATTVPAAYASPAEVGHAFLLHQVLAV